MRSRLTWLSSHSSARSGAAVPSTIRNLGNVSAPLVYPSEVDDILYVLAGVCVALLIVLIVDQWFMGAVLSDWLL